MPIPTAVGHRLSVVAWFSTVIQEDRVQGFSLVLRPLVTDTRAATAEAVEILEHAFRVAARSPSDDGRSIPRETESLRIDGRILADGSVWWIAAPADDLGANIGQGHGSGARALAALADYLAKEATNSPAHIG